jgi:putative nucleotidyltransferase with HDIG domain
MMTREEMLKWLNERISNRNLIKHMLATEAAMGALAARFGEDAERWRAAGLLHDIDLDVVGKDMTRHGDLSADWLAEKGFPDDVVYAVRAHSGRYPLKTKMDTALLSVDPLTGLIVSAALINPTKKIADIDAAFVLKRFGEKRFAAGASRETISRCSELGLELAEFMTITLDAMKSIGTDLGL